MHKHVQGRTPFLPPLASSRVWFFKFLLIIFKTLFGSTPKTLFFSKNIMTSPLVKAQRSFLSGIRRSREQHGPKVKVTAPPIKKGSSELSGFYHSISCFLASYLVSKYKKLQETTDENFLVCPPQNMYIEIYAH